MNRKRKSNRLISYRRKLTYVYASFDPRGCLFPCGSIVYGLRIQIVTQIAQYFFLPKDIKYKTLQIRTLNKPYSSLSPSIPLQNATYIMQIFVKTIPSMGIQGTPKRMGDIPAAHPNSVVKERYLVRLRRLRKRLTAKMRLSPELATRAQFQGRRDSARSVVSR